MNAACLAFPWRHPETGVVFPPLIRMLQDAVAVGTEHSRGGGSDPSTRSVVAVEALELLYEIRVRVGALFDQRTSLEAELRELYASQPWHSTLAAWADEIWQLLDPPKTRAMRDLECPSCGTMRHVTPTGAVPTIRITLSGDDSQAECLNCGQDWHGWAGLAVLGMLAGTSPDMQAVARAITESEPDA